MKCRHEPEVNNIMEVAQAAHHATIYGIKVDVHTHRIRQD